MAFLAYRLKGVTASADELNAMDGVTATAAELNKLAGAGAVVASGTTKNKITDLTAESDGTAIAAAVNAIIDALKAFKITKTS